MKNVKPFRQRAKNTLIVAAIFLLVSLIKIVPRGLSLRLAGALARAGWLLARGERRKVRDNLVRAFGSDLDAAGRDRIGRSVLINIAKNLVDAVLVKRLMKKAPERIMKIDNIEVGLEALSRKRGLIFLTAHLGCFEMLPARFSMLGFPMMVLGTPLFDARLNRLVARHRRGFNVTYIERDTDLRAILRGLESGGAFGVLCDLDTRVESRFINFFNVPAKTPVGPFKLGVKRDIPLVPVFARRQADGTQKVTLYPPITPAGNSEEERIVSAMTAYNRQLESIVRQAPDQWIWMHERWKSRP